MTNHNEILPHIPQNDENPKRLTIANVDEEVEQLELSRSVCGSIKLYNHFGELFKFLIKENIHLSFNPAFLLLGIYPREIKANVSKKTYTRMPTAALSVIAPNLEVA